MKQLMGLVHKECGGYVAPLFAPDITEEDLREMVGESAYCMRCGGGPLTQDEMEAEWIELSENNV